MKLLVWIKYRKYRGSYNFCQKREINNENNTMRNSEKTLKNTLKYTVFMSNIRVLIFYID